MRMPPAQEAWIGRLRYVVVPIIAVLAIVTAIYLLDDANSGGSKAGGLGATGEEAGAANAVNVALAGGDGPTTPAPRVGYAAPEFTLTGLDGKPVKLSDFRGKAVLLNFFASWCPPCRAEMPDIESTYEENKAAGAVVLAVDMQEEAGVVSNYATATGLTFPIVLDRSGLVATNYRITALPTSFFIDKDGVIRDMQIGAMSKNIMLSRLKKVL